MLDAKQPYVLEESDGVMKVRTCAWSPPGDHPVGWGVIVTVKDNKILKVEGDPDHPITQGRLDVRNLTLDEVVYSDEQVEQLATKIERMLDIKREPGMDATDLLRTVAHDYQHVALQVI